MTSRTTRPQTAGTVNPVNLRCELLSVRPGREAGLKRLRRLSSGADFVKMVGDRGRG